MLEINKVYNEDCIEGIKKIDMKLDALITDPPYNVSQKSNFHTMGRKGVDFGEWDKGFNLTSWIEPAVNTLKNGANIIIFNDWKNMSYIKDELEKLGCLIKQMIIWQKPNPMPRNRDRLYVTSCEFAVWATKGKGWTFNRERDTYENAIFTYPSVHSSKRIHPTEKPIGLLEEIIKIHTNENDTILDPFAGSSSICEACINTNRNYIGFELDNTYFILGQQRIDNLLHLNL